MPELPEVEIVRRRLHPRLVGRTVTGLVVDDDLVSPQSEAELQDLLVGRVVTDTGRRGKWLLLELDAPDADPAPAASAGPAPGEPASSERRAEPAPGTPVHPCSRASLDGRPGVVAIIHLRMTGRLLFAPEAEDLGRRPRFTITVDDGTRLLFFDMRRFGRIWAFTPEDAAYFLDSRVGVEPLGDEFTVDHLRAQLKGRRAPLKSVLLDQRRLAGVGNIYADEALFRARLHPLRPAGSIGPREARRLHAAIRETLELGISHEGSSVESFVDPAGARGRFQTILNVYQRTGQPCHACGTPIERVVVGGRGTHFCPRCQPLRRGGSRTACKRGSQ